MINKIKKYINKHKKELIILLSVFLLYFILGLIITYYYNVTKDLDILFDTDISRVFGDITMVNYNHYRTSVHPIYVLLLQPLIKFLNIFIGNYRITIILFQSILSSISVVLINKILNKINDKKYLNLLLTLIFAFSFGQVFFTSIVESFIYAQVLLVLMWYYVINHLDKELKIKDYIIIILLGIGSIAITLTNFIQFIIALFILIFNKNSKDKNINKIIKYIYFLIIVVCITFILSLVQSAIWNTASNFLVVNLKGFLNGTSEEINYMNSISFNNFINIFNTLFAYQDGIFSLELSNIINFKSNVITNIYSLIMFIIYTFLNIIYIIKTKFNIKKDKLYYALLATLLCNLILHLIYGNDTSFLYTCHFYLLYILTLGYILKDYKILNNKIIMIIGSLISLILSLRGMYLLIQIIDTLYKGINYFSILPIIIIGFTIILLISIIFNNKIFKTGGVLLIIIFSINSYIKLNENYNYTSDIINEYNNKLVSYTNQIKKMKKEFDVKNYMNLDDEIGIFYFGMASTNKILYKEGKLIDLKSKKILFEVDYKKDLIVPNEYTVILVDKNNKEYKIYENEKGMYIESNGEIETIFERKNGINLPTFEEYKYSEILKVLHQEILYNIKGSVPIPNVNMYNEAWYRDGMLASMVLEETDNIDSIKPWVESINKIYDNARSYDINEVDNLGELLYIIGASGVEKKDLIEKIKEEIEN